MNAFPPPSPIKNETPPTTIQYIFPDDDILATDLNVGLNN